MSGPVSHVAFCPVGVKEVEWWDSLTSNEEPDGAQRARGLTNTLWSRCGHSADRNTNARPCVSISYGVKSTHWNVISPGIRQYGVTRSQVTTKCRGRQTRFSDARFLSLGILRGREHIQFVCFIREHGFYFISRSLNSRHVWRWGVWFISIPVLPPPS